MIPLVDLRAQYETVKDEVQRAVSEVLESGRYVLGRPVAAFEEEFAAYTGARHGVAVSSGTAALHLALLAAGARPGDEVVTVPFTFVATVAAIGYVGARPALVDIDPETLTMDPGRVEPALTERTRAILPVHLYGQPADMEPICAAARRRGVAVIEDASQAHGARYKGRRTGSLGDAACFSFYPSKNLGAYGEAGMVVTDHPEYAQAIRRLRDWGQEAKYQHVVKGYNYRMDALQAAILRVKLRHLDEWTTARRRLAAIYDECLRGAEVAIPRVRPDAEHAYHIYAVRTRRRALVQAALAAAGIETGIHYPVPVHLLEAWQTDLGHRAGDFPAAEGAAAEVLSLPLYAELAPDSVRRVAELVRRHAA